MSLDSFLYLSNSIQGEAQDDKHKGADGWIDILSWSWGMSQSASTQSLPTPKLSPSLSLQSTPGQPSSGVRSREGVKGASAR